MTDPKQTIDDRFIRWQGYTLEQLGYLNNLLLGIGVAALGFQINLLYEETFQFFGFDKVIYVCSISLLFLSTIFGVWTGFSRLTDFRLTMQVTKTQGVERHETRGQANKYGRLTWCLFSVQSIGIGLAFVFLSAFYICQFLHKY
jgi:hypothetical protein